MKELEAVVTLGLEPDTKDRTKQLPVKEIVIPDDVVLTSFIELTGNVPMFAEVLIVWNTRFPFIVFA